MKTLKHILLALSILAAVGCAKEELRPDVPTSDVPIFFKGNAESKSVFDSDNFQTAGNQITVYDKYENPDGWWTMYFDGLPATKINGETYWNYGEKKYWTKDGVHNFTAYTTKNATEGTGTSLSTLPVAVKYNSTDKSLTVPENGTWTLDLNNQFDFCYGSHTRDLNSNKNYGPVNLQMKHLFATICFRVYNQTIKDVDENNFINIDNFNLSGIDLTGSATINYDSDAEVKLKGDMSTDQLYVEPNAKPQYNEPEIIYKNKGTGSKRVGSDGCLLVWPQDIRNNPNAKVEMTYTKQTSHLEEIETRTYSDSFTDPEEFSAPSRWGTYKTWDDIYKYVIQKNNLEYTIRDDETGLRLEECIPVEKSYKKTTNSSLLNPKYLVTIKYTITYYGSTKIIDKPDIKPVSLPLYSKTGDAAQWNAGNKYIYNIYIKDNYISFALEVVPWEIDDVILEE